MRNSHSLPPQSLAPLTCLLCLWPFLKQAHTLWDLVSGVSHAVSGSQGSSDAPASPLPEPE